MDTNRFRKRTNYALPPKRPAPVLDQLGQLRQTPAQSPSPAAPPSAAPAPKPVDPPRPVYEPAAAKADDGVIDLSEPTHAGWLDAIAPEADVQDPLVVTT